MKEINLNYMWHFYAENYKILLKDIKDVLNKYLYTMLMDWKDQYVKMSVLLKIDLI